MSAYVLRIDTGLGESFDFYDDGDFRDSALEAYRPLLGTGRGESWGLPLDS